MDNLPLVSIIIPAYNHEQYIAESIQSIADQDYSNLEIIVINDGSTDSTAVIAKQALVASGRIFQLVTQENAGAHAAINRGMAMAQGEYLTILNSDDYFLSGRLRRMVEKLQSTNQRFAYSKVQHIDSNGEPHPYQAAYLHQLKQAQQFPTINFELMRNNITVTTGNFFLHRSLYEEVGEFASFITSDDWDFILRILLIEEPLFVDEILLAYRIHAKGTLQLNLGSVNQEIQQIFVNYLKKSNQSTNLLAPSFNNWGDYWLFFSQTYMARVCELSEVRELLNEMNASEINDNADLIFSISSSSNSKFISLDSFSDLDLTQVNIHSLSPKSIKSEKKQPRLLFIIPWMVMGGAERFLLNTMDILLENGWDLSILCTSRSDNNWRSEFSKRSDKIIVLPDILTVKHYIRFIRYWIDRFDFDAIMLQGSIEGYRLLPILRSLFPQIPIIDYLHFVTPDWMNGGFPRLSAIYRDCLDRTITSCEQVKQWMISEGVSEKKLRVSPIGVDHLKWKPDLIKRNQSRENLGIKESDVVIIFAARLEPQKQPLVFLETMRNLYGLGSNFQALVAGDGSMKNELEELILQNDLSCKIRLLGEISSEAMPALLAAGDIFFLPSQNEGISSGIYEAMASGLPVVGADVGGQSELVTRDCGILLPKISLEDQATAYTQILQELIMDEMKRQALKVSARERIASHFTLEQTGNNFLKIINETIQGKRQQNIVTEKLTEDELFLRNSQHIIEYLQARDEWHKKNDQINELANKYELLNKSFLEAIAPKPASHWFYLWIRQLFIPIFNNLGDNKIKKSIVKFKNWIKNLFEK